MKINPSSDRLATDKTAAASPGERGKAGPAERPAGGNKSDSISLSPLSAQLQALEASLSSGSEFDRTKVEEIKTAIRDGSLKINPDVIADRMLSQALALLGKDK